MSDKEGERNNNLAAASYLLKYDKYRMPVIRRTFKNRSRGVDRMFVFKTGLSSRKQSLSQIRKLNSEVSEGEERILKSGEETWCLGK